MGIRLISTKDNDVGRTMEPESADLCTQKEMRGGFAAPASPPLKQVFIGIFGVADWFSFNLLSTMCKRRTLLHDKRRHRLDPAVAAVRHHLPAAKRRIGWRDPT